MFSLDDRIKAHKMTISDLLNTSNKLVKAIHTLAHEYDDDDFLYDLNNFDKPNLLDELADVRKAIEVLRHEIIKLERRK